MPYIVSITAHRRLVKEDIGVIHSVMKALVTKAHVDEIWFGGALGGDTEALRGALHHRGSSSRPRLVVVVPDTLERQPRATQEWTKQADEIIELKNPITVTDGFHSYILRDNHLVEVATSVVGFFSGNYSTGTGKTLRLAEAKGTPVVVIPVRPC